MPLGRIFLYQRVKNTHQKSQGKSPSQKPGLSWRSHNRVCCSLSSVLYRWPGMIEADPDIGEYFLFSSRADSLPVSIMNVLLVLQWRTRNSSCLHLRRVMSWLWQRVATHNGVGCLKRIWDAACWVKFTNSS